MLVLALDTTTRLGSHALVRGGQVVAVGVGGVDRPHAVRLPGELLDLLACHGLSLRDVDAFAVAAGPGSFTGLRIGIASMQGLAFGVGRPIVGIPVLDALARTGAALRPPGVTHVGVWMDALRGEVFAALYRCGDDGPDGMAVALEEAAQVGAPEAVAARWRQRGVRAALFVGDGALTYRTLLESQGSLAGTVVEPVPPAAPAVATLAEARLMESGPHLPHAVVPIYVRRPDAELARDRHAQRP